MEISHPWHPHHPLFLSGEANSRDDCSICKLRLGGYPFYACVDCKYYVHEVCAQLPLQIQHQFHPPHPLSLSFGVRFACECCHKMFPIGLRFGCSDCDFYLDVICALMSDVDTEGKEFIRHFTHQHPLTICSNDGDNPLNCFACKQTTSDLIYGCTPCDYFLHKSCAQISTHVLHPRHPKHALTLGVKYGLCNYCGMLALTWKYYCSNCNFFLDGSCLIESAKDAQNSRRSCFLCGKQHLDSDSCIDSLFFINQSYIQLPGAIKHKFHGNKPLSLLGAENFACDSCYKRFYMESHYGCEECNFRLDVKCALMPSIQHEESDESVCPVIPHHFKHQHPLQLISDDKVYDINCYACHTTKPSHIYGCIKCEYFLHQSCLELPIHIEHPLHDRHVLILQPLGHNFCQICCRKYDGFAFGCLQCLFFVGIECILEIRPTVVLKYHPIEHKSHSHLLCLIENSYLDRCNADNTICQFSEESNEFKLTKSYSLRCIKCDYNLHFLCGPLPCTIKHKSHIHSLKLADYIVEDDSDEHYCDICEEIRNPRLCVYYCKDCSFFSHVHCVISEIINVLKKNPKNVELRIVGDFRYEDTTNPSRDNSTGRVLIDILKLLDANDIFQLSRYFPRAELFDRGEYFVETREQKSSSEDDTMNFIEEFSFYDNDIFFKIEKRLEFFQPCTKYHIQSDEFRLCVIEVEGYKIASKFSPIFRTLLMKYPGLSLRCRFSKNLKCILFYFLCRVLRNMSITFVADITEKQFFTWHYYVRCLSDIGFNLEFVEPFLERITRSYFGIRAMKFENEVPSRLHRHILNLEQKISNIKTEIEELKWLGQQHRVGKIAEESSVMQEFFTEAKKLKWQLAALGSLIVKLPAHKAVTREDGERVICAEARNDPEMSTTLGGVAASMAAAASLNQNISF